MTRLHMDYFTIDTYVNLVLAASERYRFIGFDDSSLDDEVTLWRHDIDFSPQRALALAQIESELGVSATYFFQISSRYYSILEPEIASILRQILSLGHKIGLHFDAEVCAHQAFPDYDRRITFEANVLAETIDSTIGSFTLHNPTTLAGVSLDEPYRAGLVNGSSKKLLLNYAYCSDSNGLWRHLSLSEMIADPKATRLYALTHPEWWQVDDIPPRQRLQRCIDGRAKFCSRYYDSLLNEYKRPNIATYQ